MSNAAEPPAKPAGATDAPPVSRATPSGRSERADKPVGGPVQGPAPESPWAWLWSQRHDPPFWASKALGATCILLILAVWWLFTRGEVPEDRWISPSKLPSPGDVIGETGWLVVDRRSDRRNNTYVIVMGPEGQMRRRDRATDRRDPEYEELRLQSEAGLAEAEALSSRSR